MTNIFLSVLEMSVSISFIVAALILLTPFLSKRYAAKWKYLIWICLALRLLIPFSVGDVQSVLGVWSQTEARTPFEPEEKDTDTPADGAMPPGRVMIEIPAQMTTPIAKQSEASSVTLLDILAFVWMMGSLIFISMHLASYLHYKRQVMGQGTIIEDSDILQRISELKHELHITRTVRAVEYSEADSPMILGFFKPVLILPEEQYSLEEQFFILKHELVHLKRGDVFIKLLFVAANALHWFNPLIWIMQKEAGVDMELSCDERVTRGSDYAMRKAYTETLLSTLHRRGTKKTVLSTQFYGGKQIMKKRFKNILAKNGKKNGVAIFICAIILSISSGTLLGCTIAKAASGNETILPKPPASDNPFEAMAGVWHIDFDRTDATLWGSGRSYGNQMVISETGEFSYYIGIGTGGTGLCVDKDGAITVKVEPYEEHSSEEEILTLKYVGDDGNGYILMDWWGEDVYWKRESGLSDTSNNGSEETGTSIEGADIQEMKDIIEEFATCYFGGDAVALQKYLTSSYQGDIDTYEGAGTADNFTIKGLPNVGERNVNNQWEVSLEFMDSEEDSYTYLTFSFVKQEGDWKVQSYSLEK